MSADLLETDCFTEPPDTFLRRTAHVFAVFDHQHNGGSGNVAYGVETAGRRYFVKTAGSPDVGSAAGSYAERVALLENAVRIAAECAHSALPKLAHVITQTPVGPVLIYEWIEGESLAASREDRENPKSAYRRFMSLPAKQVVASLGVIYDAHAMLAEREWVAVDFYDGSLMYDFPRDQIHIVDIDMYHKGPFLNTMGEMFGSSRFMAPEEHVLGAEIDQRTTVFTMGRLAAVFLGNGTLDRTVFRGDDALFEIVARACRERPEERYQLMKEYYAAWASAISQRSSKDGAKL